MHAVASVARLIVFVAFALSVLVAGASWLVRTRRVTPFGALGRWLRAASDPFINPVERRLVRSGGNPVHAGGWLVVVVAAGGVVLLSLFEWGLQTFTWMYGSLTGGPRALLAFLIVALYDVLFAALLVRVIASWFGAFRYSRWMRPVYALTDWLVEPIRRLIPPAGSIDWSPLAAWAVLWVVKQLLLSIL